VIGHPEKRSGGRVENRESGWNLGFSSRKASGRGKRKRTKIGQKTVAESGAGASKFPANVN
jgi:hypothetical protein